MISRIVGFCGVVGPLITLSLILVAVSRSPWFSWTGNYLSDLGANQDAVAVLFNSGLIIGGAVTAIFAVGLKVTLPGLTRGGVGAIALVLGAVALCCVGIFPEPTGAVHDSFALLSFTLIVIALLLIGSAMMQEPAGRNLGLFIFITGLFICPAVVTLVVMMMVLPQVGGAIPELVISIGSSVSLIILGVRFSKRVPHRIRGLRA
jgi:hypothetical membrane protein